jgi:hypothetical protein
VSCDVLSCPLCCTDTSVFDALCQDIRYQYICSEERRLLPVHAVSTSPIHSEYGEYSTCAMTCPTWTLRHCPSVSPDVVWRMVYVVW